MNIEREYSEMVAALAKPGHEILHSMGPNDAHNLHMAVGISGEAGELLDAIKKAVIYRKPLDTENVIEELGDLEYYLHGLRDSLGISREETIIHNMNKLRKRYPSGNYTNAHAQTRLDKA